MNIYYVDPDAPGSGTGLDWTNAFTQLQTISGVMDIGDKFYCRGTEAISSTILFDDHDGSASGVIEVIGVNSEGVDDGTFYTIDGTAVTTGIQYDDQSWLMLKNIEVKNCAGDGIDLTQSLGRSSYCFFWKCYIHDNGGYGIDDNSQRYLYCIQCTIANNTSIGILDAQYGHILFCDIYGNGGLALKASSTYLVYGNTFHDNAGAVSTYGAPCILMNNVIDDEPTGYTDSAAASHLALILNRFTNISGYAIDPISANTAAMTMWNMFDNCDGNFDTDYVFLLGDTNVLASGVQGYVDQENSLYNLDSTKSPSIYNEPIQVGCV